MSAAILRINTATNSRTSPNSRGSSDSDQMPALISESDSDSNFETMPALVDDDIEVVHEATTRRTRHHPNELAGYSFSDFFFDDSPPNNNVYDAGPHDTILVFDGFVRGITSLGKIYMLDAYHQKTNATVATA